MKRILALLLCAVVFLSGCSSNTSFPDYPTDKEATGAVPSTPSVSNTPLAVPTDASSVTNIPYTDEMVTTEETYSAETTSEITSENASEITSEVTAEPTSESVPNTDVPTKTAHSVVSTESIPPEASVPIEITVASEKVTTASSQSTKQTELKSPSPAVVLKTTADGTKYEKNEKAEIDYSNAANGYMMCRYFGEMKRAKILVDTPNGLQYIYDLNVNGSFEVFTFTEGNGIYGVTICEQVTQKYGTALKLQLDVKLSDALKPFLTPNQYVNFDANSKAVSLAESLCSGTDTTLEKLDKIYCWIVDNVKYDKVLAANVGKNYIPSVDKAITEKKGICSEYTAAITAMLRSQQVPTKLIVGYAGTIYHAWISVYTKEQGWIDGIIYFDGSSWHRMDPTFAVSNDSSKKIVDYISTDSNYTGKYIY